MAMAEIPVKIQCTDLILVKTLIDMLAKNLDDLPDPVVGALNRLAEDAEHIIYNADDYINDCVAKKLPNNSQIETDFKSFLIKDVNTVLRRVSYIDDSGVTQYAYPEKLRLGSGGYVFLQWGYDE